MAAAGAKRPSWGSHLVLFAALGYLLALVLLLTEWRLSGSRHSSIVWTFRRQATTTNASGQGCTQSQLSSQTPAARPAAPSWPPSLPAAPWPFPGVMRGFYSESDVTISPWCNETFTRQHPLTTSDYERSFTPGAPCSMPSGLLDVLQSGSRELTITVVGGSMTQGASCLEGQHPMCKLNDRQCNQLRCAWPTKMQDRLRQLFPAGRVSVRNKARPSWSYSNWLESGTIDTLVETDVLIIDLQVNSQVYKQDLIRQMEEADLFIYNILAAADRQRRSVGVMFVENFLTCGNLTALCDAHCPEDRQGRMQYNFVGLNQTYGWCNRWWTIGSLERPIVQHYELPTASYREAVWPSFSKPNSLLPCFWNGFSHPDAAGHLLFSDVVTYGLVRSLTDGRNRADMCQPRQSPTKFHQRLASTRYCTPHSTAGANASNSTGTYLSPAYPSSFQPLGVTGPWTFREDRPGKPGWIFEPGFHQPDIPGQITTAQPPPSTSSSTAAVPPNDSTAPLIDSTAISAPSMMQPPGNVSNSIWFEVEFSSQPQLQVTYLASYTLIGVAELAIYSSSSTGSTSSALARYTLDGRLKDRYSIPRTTVLVHPRAGKTRGKFMEQLPDRVQQGTYVIAIRPVNGTNLQGSKFKLLGVSSC